MAAKITAQKKRRNVLREMRGAGNLRQRLQLSRRANTLFARRNGRQTIAQVSHDCR
ncbi:MAG: hypothetical protein V9G12_16580 [Microthrixaceae bacterium]